MITVPQNNSEHCDLNMRVQLLLGKPTFFEIIILVLYFPISHRKAECLPVFNKAPSHTDA
jgi:hypothetical protein